MRPMKKVKPSRRSTPKPVSLFFSMAQKKPKATAKNTTNPRKGLCAMKLKPIAMPSQAPMTVGTIDSAKRA